MTQIDPAMIDRFSKLAESHPREHFGEKEWPVSVDREELRLLVAEVGRLQKLVRRGRDVLNNTLRVATRHEGGLFADEARAFIEKVRNE